MAFEGIGYGPRIESGAGAAGRIGTLLEGERGACRVLLVGDRALAELGLVAPVLSALEQAGHAVVLFIEIAGEPAETVVEAARRLGRAEGCDAVVCLGGGSALDAGKLAAALLGSERPVSAFRLAAEPLPERTVPLVCVPTTAGTGSEMTGISVVSDGRKVKFWYWGAPLQADCAVLDPDLTVGLPPAVTATTGMDALVHAIEAATNRHAGGEGDVAAYRAIRLASANLRNAVREPRNIAARTAMLEAAGLGGLAIQKAGTALAHNIGHALGSISAVPHGLAVAAAMAATIDWVVAGNRPAFASVAEAMGEGRDPDRVPAAFRGICEDIGIPEMARRALAGLSAAELAAHMAAPENATMRKSTARPVTDADLLSLAEATLAYGGGTAAAG
ncbi:iron-containing alcohol dehydrogenase [Propylenella binzhouense]|uniref:Iron-containing alcohol dehydrogenase n=1 Tax=Propylenella binzhouense TaxID=2555902 RepID=A0A964T416_9HYPH|nr:iron-containing alcohol dehydrogenase [Propylenella binzhouense]MYZ48043.1 iron-containing alcohol dehydrogenase [Propylenella binzhouense]